MAEYSTSVYSTVKNPYSFKVSLKGDTNLEFRAFNDLQKYDLRRGGYQMFVGGDDDATNDQLQLLLGALKKEVKVFKSIAPVWIDAVAGMLSGITVSDVLRAVGCVYYSEYMPNMIYASEPPATNISMFVDGYKIDPKQEVIHYTTLANRDTTPEYNVISTPDMNILAKNLLFSLKGEAKVFVMQGYDYVSVSANCGYFVYDNDTVIWLVTLNTIVASVEENYPSGDSRALYTETPSPGKFYRAMMELKMFNRIVMDTDGSIYVEDVKWKLLAFAGNFPCSRTLSDFEALYRAATTLV
jgi:hypothetical protein